MIVCVGYFVFISYSKLVEKNWMAREYVRKIGPTSWVILPPSHQNLVTVTTLNLQISWNWLENWHFETWQTEILDTKELAVCIVCRSRQLMWSPNICIKYRKYWKKLCEFSIVWADRTDLGSQKLFSKLTTISPSKTYDNFQINIQKITQIRKSWAP